VLLNSLLLLNFSVFRSFYSLSCIGIFSCGEPVPSNPISLQNSAETRDTLYGDGVTTQTQMNGDLNTAYLKHLQSD